MNQSALSPLDHPLLSARYFYPWPSRFEEPYLRAAP